MVEDREVIRYTMQSFIGSDLNDISISSRQKEAIQRLMLLSEDKFDSLCNDIKNEIQRRNGIPMNTDGYMQEKLSKLTAEKFKSLVMDALLVFNYKNPCTKSMLMGDFLSNLENLISDLKSKSGKESFISKIEGLGFKNMINEYIKYIKKSEKIDSEIHNYIEDAINQEIEKQCDILLECLSHPLILLKKLDNTFLGNNEEYLFHRYSIMSLLSKENCPTNEISKHENIKLENRSESYNENMIPKDFIGKELKEKILKSEMLQVLSLYIRDAKIPIDDPDYFSEEIKKILSVLEIMKKDITGEEKIDLINVSNDLLPVIDKMITKCTNLGDKYTETSNNLKIQRHAIESFSEITDKKEAFRNVLELAVDVEKMF